MEVDTEILADMWITMQEYISPKDIQIAADHVISIMSDHAISEINLKIFAGADEHLKAALDDYLDEENEAADDYNDEYNTE